MKKKSWIVLLVLLIVLLFFISMMIPYFTGRVAEQRFLAFYQSNQAEQPIKTLEHAYQRGWFGSFAQALLETPNNFLINNHHRFLLTHDIHHGWIPLQSVLIDTTLQLFQQPTPVSQTLKKSLTPQSLFEIQTVVQPNGDSVSELSGLPFTASLETVTVQGEQVEGELSVEKQASLFATDFKGLNWQIISPQRHFTIPQWALHGTLQIDNAQPWQGLGDFYLTQLQLSGFQLPKITLAKVRGQDIFYQIADHFTIITTAQIAEIQIDNELMGPMSGEIVVQHWHLASFVELIKQLTTTSVLSSLRSKMTLQSKMTLLKLVPQAVIWLQNTPQLQINALNLQTSAGSVTGDLQLQVQPFNFSTLMLFKPALLLRYLQGKLDLMVPQALLESKQLSSWGELGERLKAWRDQHILIPAPNQPDYYLTAMQLNQGILQVNGQQRPIEILLSK